MWKICLTLRILSWLWTIFPLFVSDILWDNSHTSKIAHWYCWDRFSESENQHRGTFHELLAFECDCSPPFPLDCSGNRWFCLIPPTGNQRSAPFLSQIRCDTLSPFAPQHYWKYKNNHIAKHLPNKNCMLLVKYIWLPMTTLDIGLNWW